MPESAIEDAATADPAPRRASHVGRGLTLATILGLPIVLVLVLRLPLVNQLQYADAWFYSGYGWVPHHHLGVFDLNYFAVRFPATLSIGAFERVFGAQGGYLVLRYLLVVGAGTALYVLVTRFATRWVALASVALLYLTPFFSRLVLWDYSFFLTVTAGIMGVAVWWLSDRSRIRALVAGALLAIALFAQTSFLIALVPFVLVEVVGAVRERRLRDLLVRALAALVGGLAVYLVGWLAYTQIRNGFSITEMLEPTIDYLRDNEQNTGPFVRPTSEWLWREPRIWAPIALSVALVCVMRRRLLGSTLEARIAQFCVGYVGITWISRFATTSSGIETWWAYSVLIVAMAPALGVLLHEVSRRSGAERRVLLAAAGGSVLLAIAVRWIDAPALDAYRWIADHQAMVIVLLVVAVVVAVAAGARATRVAATAVVALCAILTFLAFSPSVMDGRGTTGTFVVDAGRDWDAYGDGKRFAELVRDHDGPGERMLLWYPVSPVTDIAWVNLPHLGHTVQQVGTTERMDQISPTGMARLIDPAVRYVLVMSEQATDLELAAEALRREGFRAVDVRRGALIDGRLDYRLLRLDEKPAT